MPMYDPMANAGSSAGTGGGGSATNQAGSNAAGKRGMKGSRDRLWSDEFGGGFLDRQTLDPGVMQMMQQAAMGQGQSPASILGRAMLGQNQSQAYGMAAGAGGMSPALAMRQAQQSASQMGLQSQAQFGAMNADWQSQMQNNYLNAQLAQQGMNDQAAMNREQLLANYVTGGAGIRMQEQQNNQWWKQMLGQAAGGAAEGLGKGLGMKLFSDPNLKHDIHPAGESVDEVLNTLEPLSFKYVGSEKSQLGITTRELGKTQLGAATLRSTERGDGIDIADGLSLVLAAVARLNQRINELEKKLEK